MNLTTLLKVLAFVSANKNQNGGGGLTGVPVHFMPEEVAHPKASLTIDLNNRVPLVENGDVANGNNTFNATAPVNLTETAHDLDRDPRENEINPHPNEITALEVWHDPNSVVYKPYFARDGANDANDTKAARQSEETREAKKTTGSKVTYHMSPKEALANVVESMEQQLLPRCHSVYESIGEYMDFNYQKYQEIQYLSYSDEKKQEIILKAQELKDAIMREYVKARVFSKFLERYRAKLTTVNDPPSSYKVPSIYWPQPKTVPEVWYLLYNIETIMMQLFTPKPQTHTFWDDSAHVIRMLRAPTVQMIPRNFLPVPQYNIHNNTALDQMFGAITGTEDASNEFEQATFSKDKYEQQVIVFFLWKYFEYITGDLARHVNYIADKLKKLEANTESPDLIQIEEQKELLAAKYLELKHATIRMETYRTNPVLINVYNAEANAMQFLPGTKHVTKLDGGRVTIKAHDDAIAALETAPSTDIATVDEAGVDPTAQLPKPVEWDQNWPWDF